MTDGARLQYMPVSIFSTVMGMSGLTIAMQKSALLWTGFASVCGVLAVLTSLLFAVLIALYINKLLRYPDAVREELKHPVKLSFTATISISLILLGTVFVEAYPQLSFYLWSAGTGLHLLFTLYVLSSWIHHSHYEITHINPAWFIPVVGNILVPVAGVHHVSVEISWFFYAIGLVFWLVLFTIIMYRVIFHAPLAEKLWPTLFILIAPPAVGFIAYVKLSGDIDSFARILYYLALFITLLLLVQWRRFIGLPFFLSWWAYSFPLAAMTIASFVMYQHLHYTLLLYIGAALLVLLLLVIAVLVVNTVRAVIHHQICVED